MKKLPVIRVAVDWGSSSLRAYRLDKTGQVIDKLACSDGIKNVVNGNFEATLFSHIGQWLAPGDAILLSGMITSRSGWVETPYINCPVEPAAAAHDMLRITVRGHELLFMSGLSQSGENYDVMRGEELQLLGVSQQLPTSEATGPTLIVLPGTHSKWALADQRQITAFATIATGELFDCLINHSLIGEFADAASWDDDAFTRGVSEGYATQRLISQLFHARAGVLLAQLSAEQIYAYLSGLLIGNEIKEGLAFASQYDYEPAEGLALVGSALLCQRYHSALEALTLKTIATLTDTAAAGYSSIVTSMRQAYE